MDRKIRSMKRFQSIIFARRGIFLLLKSYQVLRRAPFVLHLHEYLLHTTKRFLGLAVKFQIIFVTSLS